MVIPGHVPKRPRPLWLMEDCEAMVGSQINEKQVFSVRTALVAKNHFRQRNHWGYDCLSPNGRDRQVRPSR